MSEYLEVLFPGQRDVLVNGDNLGETNIIHELEAGRYEVTLGPPANFTPSQYQIDLRNTSAMTPLQIKFEEL